MRKKAEIQINLTSLMCDVVMLSKRYDGIRALYEAACFAQDGETAATYRDQIHQLTDEQLDCAARQMSLMRELIIAPD